MPDNVAVTAGSGTTIATDLVGSAHYQKIKVFDGTADSENGWAVNASGMAYIKMTEALPVGGNTIGNVAMTSLPALPTGTNIIGAFKRDVINYTPIRKYSLASFASESVVWTPTGGKKFAITDIVVSAVAASTCTLRDGLASNTIIRLSLAANGGWSSNFQTPIVSGAVDNVLTIEPSAPTQYILVNGYEI